MSTQFFQAFFFMVTPGGWSIFARPALHETAVLTTLGGKSMSYNTPSTEPSYSGFELIRIGIIGKTNTGKTTFFNAATSSTAEVSTYPFTTKKPNVATGQVQTLCVCRELGLKDKPRNSTCVDGWRFIPVEVLDLPGLIKGAWKGKGLAGIGVRLEHVTAALEAAKLPTKHPKDWKDEDSRKFSENIRLASKPTLIIANKMDLAYSEKNFERLREEFSSQLVIPASSEAELALKRAQEKGLIQYVPGEETFKVLDESRISKDQAWALAYVQQKVMTKLMRTGVEFALNSAVFKLLGMNAVYPVED